MSPVMSPPHPYASHTDARTHHDVDHTSTRLDKITGYLTAAATTLGNYADIFGTPFLKLISSLTLSLVTSLQTVRRKREECAELLERVHALLYAIISLHAGSDVVVENLPPATLDCIGKFMQTLQKIHVFVDAQQEAIGKIRQFLRQSENNTLLRDCNTGLDRALNILKAHVGPSVLRRITNMQRDSQKMHEEVLELIATVSDGTASDRISMACDQYYIALLELQ
ncbi:hypothetical protein DFH07DRAFT_9309 [Mycena maculata]|uniref:Uncharacterized protein n=1 Tax=Mycena maculata TaxID=230809 RepID=A0AAD7K3G0_9AGAR|nr:hypothetical protein DFH07DRAFT_9309 [Mycena maculata]